MKWCAWSEVGISLSKKGQARQQEATGCRAGRHDLQAKLSIAASSSACLSASYPTGTCCANKSNAEDGRETYCRFFLQISSCEEIDTGSYLLQLTSTCVCTWKNCEEKGSSILRVHCSKVEDNYY